MYEYIAIYKKKYLINFSITRYEQCVSNLDLSVLALINQLLKLEVNHC